MVNPTELDELPAVLAASTTEQTIALSTQRRYTFLHDGEDVSAAPDSATIYLAYYSTVDADASEGGNKAKLKGDRIIEVGPGISSVRFKTSAGAPTMTVLPSRQYFGDF